DQMATEAAGRRQGLFQIDPGACLEIDKGRALQGFPADIGTEAVTGQFHGGQADAVDGNAVAELDVAQIEFAGGHLDAYVTALGGQAANGAYRFDYAGKHETSRRSLSCMVALLFWLKQGTAD